MHKITYIYKMAEVRFLPSDSKDKLVSNLVLLPRKELYQISSVGLTRVLALYGGKLFFIANLNP